MMLDKFISYITEKISIIEVNYGNKKPFTNKDFSETNDEIFTFFEHENNIIVLSYDKNVKSFNFSIQKENNNITRPLESNISFKNMQTLYGKLLYVFQDLCARYNISNFIVYSHPDETKLVKLYNNFANNLNVRNIIRNMGFINYRNYRLKQDGYTFIIHEFSKKKNILNLVKKLNK